MGDAQRVHVQARAAFLRAMGAVAEGYTPYVFAGDVTREEVSTYYKRSVGEYPTVVTLLHIRKGGEVVELVAIPREELYEEYERGAARRGTSSS